MALKTFKPITPGLRQLVIVDRSELHKGKPVKTLTEGKSQKGGRNNTGRITVRASSRQSENLAAHWSKLSTYWAWVDC
jgi:ribosomal protein L2